MSVRNKKAFTIAELTIVIIVLAVLALISLNSMTSERTVLKKVSAYSTAFYNEVFNTYESLILFNSSGKSIITMNDINGDKSINATDIATYFSRKVKGTVDSQCKNLSIATSSPVASLKTGAVCVDFANITAGFGYNSSCNTSITVKEFLSKEEINCAATPNCTVPQRTASNLCGWVIYSTARSTGTFKKDLFTIPLGKKYVE